MATSSRNSSNKAASGETRLLMISSDGHVAPQYFSDYRQYIDPEFRDDFETVVAEFEKASLSRISPSPLFFDKEVVERHIKTVVDPFSLRGEWDPVFRAEQMAREDGCVGEILFHQSLLVPFSPGFISSGFNTMTGWSRRHRMAGAKAYNRWLADFVSAAPERYCGQAMIFFDDVDAAIEEVRWAKEHGLKGIIAPGCESGTPFHWHPRYEPFWSVCEELDMPLNYHVGAGEAPGDMSPEIRPDLRANVVETESPMAPRRHLPYMIYSGVLERHPGLKIVFTEIKAEWAPALVANMDWVWRSGRTPHSTRDLCPQPPSVYWDRQCYIGASLASRAELEHHKAIGPNRMMFGIDFPHVEASTGHNLEYLRAILGGTDMTDEQVRAFIGETAVKVFNFDREKLLPIAAEYGYTMSQVREDLPFDQLPEMLKRSDIDRPWGGDYVRAA